jgi:hypothetical protein
MRMFENYVRFYSSMTVTMLTDCVIDFNREILNSPPTEKLLIEGAALFDFISSITDNSELRSMAKSRADYFVDLLNTTTGFNLNAREHISSNSLI